jgi:CRISPR system Cascade subunit CasD
MDIDVMVLRFDAPLMSFGSVVVDQINRTDLYPYRAMLVGLIANALGLTRGEVDAHESLQRRLRYAARRDRAGCVLVDYQTVDFEPDGPMASNLGWTAEGLLEERRGGDASEGTHIRYRHYVADAIVTVAFTLGVGEQDVPPDLVAVASALQHPARPLFLGRKCCVPSASIFLEARRAPSLRQALEDLPRVVPRGDRGPLPAIWARSEEGDDAKPRWPRVEDRDWANAIHVGRRMYVEGQVNPPTAASQRPEISA